MDHTFFLKKLEEKINFSLVRYGDGEWGCILQDKKIIKRLIENNKEKAIVFSKKFFKILESKPNYYFGVQPRAESLFKDKIEIFYKDFQNVVDGDIFHNMSENIGLKQFIKSLSKRTVILVGPKYLENLNFNFIHIVTPENNVWESYIKVKNTVKKTINIHKTDNPVILYSCSFVAKVLIHEMYNIYFDNITQIDTGSLFDPYCGLYTRNYHKKVLNKIKNNHEQWCL